MNSPNAEAREKLADKAFFNLYQICTFDSENETCPWKLSKDSFVATDASKNTPLDSVAFNRKTRKYEYVAQKSGNEDDFILQAMVMLLLFRMEYGLGKGMGMRHLSIWKGTDKKPKESDLPNLWEQDLVASGKQAGHIDNYYMFAECYRPNENGRNHSWNRRSFTRGDNKSPTRRSVLHEFAEQSVVQWALKAGKDEYRVLAVSIVKIAAGDSGALGQDVCGLVATGLLLAAKESTHNKPFCKLAMRCIKKLRGREPTRKPSKTRQHGEDKEKEHKRPRNISPDVKDQA